MQNTAFLLSVLAEIGTFCTNLYQSIDELIGLWLPYYRWCLPQSSRVEPYTLHDAPPQRGQGWLLIPNNSYPPDRLRLHSFPDRGGVLGAGLTKGSGSRAAGSAAAAGTQRQRCRRPGQLCTRSQRQPRRPTRCTPCCPWPAKAYFAWGFRFGQHRE